MSTDVGRASRVSARLVSVLLRARAYLRRGDIKSTDIKSTGERDLNGSRVRALVREVLAGAPHALPLSLPSLHRPRDAQRRGARPLDHGAPMAGLPIRVVSARGPGRSGTGRGKGSERSRATA